MDQHLFLDIETIPAQRPDVLEEIRANCTAELDKELAAICPPSNYGAEAAAKWMAEKGQAKREELVSAHAAKVEETYRKTGLDGAFGQVCVIGWAFADDEPRTVYDADDEERLLSEFARELRCLTSSQVFQTTVIGHNVCAFDLRFLVQRHIVNGVRPHPAISRAAQAKPWESEKVFDSMVQWAGTGGRISLDKLCKALGLPGKGDVDGSKVWDMVKAGRIAEVAAYCADDVRKVRAVYQRMTFQSVTQPIFEDVPA